ncbi:tissue alpha-L-fucosidase-like [Pectinophora gossypiella]|uniref:tissue alpha-L-fucosidase-like n=1 Tax=Pectinophora gossypiella TaxID=13191 RepID=UPI00214E5FE9|nr:tissue alpha-L-fucosidase-like [Pectinophora gossypiella]
MKKLMYLILICAASAKYWHTLQQPKRYKPEWEHLDTRLLPQWYDRAKIGIFVHWGVYSVPGYHSEWLWNIWQDPTAKGHKAVKNFMSRNYRPGFTYQEFAPLFTAEFFDPDQWAALFAKSGAQYVGLTSKYHDGFALYPSSHSFGWNAIDIGPHRDIVGELSKSVRNIGLDFGIYHSFYEWFNPLYLQDKAVKFLTHKFPDKKLWPDLIQLVYDYKPSIVWIDGEWEADYSYWDSTNLMAWLYNSSPMKDRVVVNDRWGRGIRCQHGDFDNCGERYKPGLLPKHKWENAFSLDRRSWGYRRNLCVKDVVSMEELLDIVVRTVSCGGNVLINVGPNREGIIAPIFQERLLGLGRWLEVNGEAIYGTSPWFRQNDTANDDVWYTCTKLQYNAAEPTAIPELSDTITAVYAIFMKWPVYDLLRVRDIVPVLLNSTYQVQMLGQKGYLEWRVVNGQALIQLPDKAQVRSDHAWTLKLTQKTSWAPHMHSRMDLSRYG